MAFWKQHKPDARPLLRLCWTRAGLTLEIVNLALGRWVLNSPVPGVKVGSNLQSTCCLAPSFYASFLSVLASGCPKFAGRKELSRVGDYLSTETTRVEAAHTPVCEHRGPMEMGSHEGRSRTVSIIRQSLSLAAWQSVTLSPSQ